MLAQIRADELDAIFTAVDPDALGDEFAATLLSEEEFVCTLPVGHPLAAQDHVARRQPPASISSPTARTRRCGGAGAGGMAAPRGRVHGADVGGTASVSERLWRWGARWELVGGRVGGRRAVC